VEARGKKIIQIDDALTGECKQDRSRHKDRRIEDVVNGNLDHEGNQAFSKRDESHQDDTQSQAEPVGPNVAEEPFQLWRKQGD